MQVLLLFFASKFPLSPWRCPIRCQQRKLANELNRSDIKLVIYLSVGCVTEW